MIEKNDPKKTNDVLAPPEREPYTAPLILEEEAFETLVLTCTNAEGFCGVRVPKST
ncbi:MAG: hypothetical protein PHU25_01050 [Deltaproteobacteria bacterium]|nr:hypothetical protein [Deltaproteobacteria bacterium]